MLALQERVTRACGLYRQGFGQRFLTLFFLLLSVFYADNFISPFRLSQIPTRKSLMSEARRYLTSPFREMTSWRLIADRWRCGDKRRSKPTAEYSFLFDSNSHICSLTISQLNQIISFTQCQRNSWNVINNDKIIPSIDKTTTSHWINQYLWQQ